MSVDLIGVPFDGYGRRGSQARAATVLRRAGLVDALRSLGVASDTDLDLPAPSPERGPTSFINDAALIALASRLRDAVGASLDAARLPVVVGGDCSMLLGIVPALVERGGGLLFIDGHEDTMPLDVSEDGEAANAELGVLLGLTGRLLTGPLAGTVGVLPAERLAVLGPRDAEWRRRFNVGSLAEVGVWMRSLDPVAADPSGSGAAAVARLRAEGGPWWLHIDLDVLDPEEFPAQGLPDVDDEPGGLTWAQLDEVATAALGAGGCVGLSLAIYDPDQDPDGTDARRIVGFAERLAAAVR